MPVRPLRVLTAAAVATAALLMTGVGTAAAHVRVSSADATPGGFGELTFRVPNESDTASTVSLRVSVPADTPLAFVSVKPVPGWTVATTTGPIDPPVEVHGTEVTEAVTEITWTADPGGGIRPGEYQTFSISAGPLPEVDSITFPAIQTYDDGMEQAWIEPTVDGQEEPDSPAPVLDLTAGGAGSQGGTDAHGGDSDSPSVSEASSGTDAAGDSDGSGLAVTALVVGIAGLVAGLAGLALGLAARRRS
ncbi:YcnI family protein [Trujillonella humicola]|uniref:YcnI family copper-binding membrane protein n=1 Tax=Trujillonella humicola TaxID=3383699 RepID=UPI003906D16E